MNILITGAGGFLGKRLTSLLAKSNHEVFAILRKPIPSVDSQYFKSKRITPIVQDLETLDTAILPKKIDAMFTLAQSSNFRNFPLGAEEIFEINTVSNLKLLNWALNSGVRKIIHASSGGVYGGSKGDPNHTLAETDQLETNKPLGFYLGTKLCSEIIFQNYAHLFDSMSILRPFFIYGPRQRDDMFIARLIKSIKSGSPITLQGENGLRVNPIYVDDAAIAFQAALSIEGSNIFNVAGEETLTLKSISEKIGKELNAQPNFINLPGQPSDYIGSTALSDKNLVFTKTPFDIGIQITCSHVL